MITAKERWTFRIEVGSGRHAYMVPERLRPDKGLTQGARPDFFIGARLRFRLADEVSLEDARRLAKLMNSYLGTVSCRCLHAAEPRTSDNGQRVMNASIAPDGGREGALVRAVQAPGRVPLLASA